MEVRRLRATLDDGTRIAFNIPAPNKDRILASLVKNAEGGPDNFIMPDKEPKLREKKPPKKRPKLASIETFLTRMEICRACPLMRDESGWTICGLCGCPMNHLNQLANMKCKDKENPKFGREAEVKQHGDQILDG